MRRDLIQDVLMHPDVSRRLCRPPYGHYGRHGKHATTGLDLLVIARVARRTRNRAARNQAEEVAAYGIPADAWERGMVCMVPKGPNLQILFARALAAGNLAEPLTGLVRRALG